MIHTTTLTETIQPPFNFPSTATAHGWYLLRPFSWDAAAQALCRVQQLTDGQIVRLCMMLEEDTQLRIEVESSAPLAQNEIEEIHQVVRRMLRLNEEFSGFYQRWDELGWTLELQPGGGRLLRCPTLFEDMIYTICTTNINWSGTVRMVDRVVAALGKSFAGQPEWRAFPGPSAFVEAGADFLKQETGLGYRSDYVFELAQQLVSGDLSVVAFEDQSLPTEDLYKRLRKIKGVGDYAASTILMLLGRYDRLAIDSELRSFTAKKYLGGEVGTPAQMREIYAPWGEWQYLAYWFDRPADR